MAEGSNGGSWWGGWLQTAKEKANASLDFVKRDLAEFTNTMQVDSTKVAETVKGKVNQENANAATQKVKEGMTSFLGGLSKALVIEAEDAHTTKKKRPQAQPIFDRAKARLQAIQLDPGTYCNPPSGSMEDFKEWVETFNLESKKGDISELLVVNAEVRSLYTQMVPSEVAHADFWQRYFYKVHQLQQDEERKTALKKRAEAVEQDDLEWDDDEWGDIAGPSSPPKSPPGGFLNRLVPIAASPLASSQQTKGEDDVEVLRVTREGIKPIDQEEEIAQRLGQTQATREHTDTAEDPHCHHTNQDVKKPCQPSTEDPKNNLKQEETSDFTLADLDPRPVAIQENSANQADNLKAETNVNTFAEPQTIQSEETDKESISDRDDINTESSIPSVEVSDESKSEEMTKVSSLPMSEDSEDGKHSLSSSPIELRADGPSANSSPLEVHTRDKGDMVMVGSDRTTPSSDTNKESSSLDDDWEKEFDIEVTEDDLRAAQEAAKSDKTPTQELPPDDDVDSDDWESWD